MPKLGIPRHWTALFFLFPLMAFGFAPQLAWAAPAGEVPFAPLNGAELGWYWAIPFAGLLGAIAVAPLVAPHWWHHHFGKVSAFFTFAFLIPFAVLFGWQLTLYEIVHSFLLEYFPFIVLLLALYVITAGVRLRGEIVGTPGANLGILTFGTIIASFMGTTGAAMLLIRILLDANKARRYKIHTFVFFILLVCNIGGSLTPIGDPPLFLGFLLGVHFFWPFQHMFLPFAIASSILLLIYYALDRYFYLKEGHRPTASKDRKTGARFAIDGWANLGLLLLTVLSVLASGLWKPDLPITIYYVPVELQDVLRSLVLLALAGTAYWITPKDRLKANSFSWFPIQEVAKLFIGLFLTIIPVLAILRAGHDGDFGAIVDLANRPDGSHVPAMYFWLTGGLSAFLDNAPTYLLFFSMAGGNAEALMSEQNNTLIAISAGAVFFGAMTYVGNAPNFMVRAIVEMAGVRMPSFFLYLLYAAILLIPIFALLTWLFF